MAERVMFVQFKTGYELDKGPAWLSGPRRDRGDTRYGDVRPIVDDDARTACEAFLRGEALPGRENG